MMTGWLIVNEFLTSQKYADIAIWLQRAAEEQSINLRCFTNAEAMRMIEPGKAPYKNAADFVVFWDKDIHLARLMEQSGLRLFNSADAIEKCDSKALTHIALQNTGIKMPLTYVVPHTYPGVVWRQCEYLNNAVAALCWPVVVKECYGSFGEQVHLAASYGELLEVMNRIGARPMLLQQFVAGSKGRDIRLYIVGGKPVACMLRTAQDGDWRANAANGAAVQRWEPTDEQVAVAQRACEALELDFAGVDILFGENEEPVLCEVNSNAHFFGIYKCTGVNVAQHIMQYVKKEAYG
jgi:RimK family alpha-L-glutamate ligase